MERGLEVKKVNEMTTKKRPISYDTKKAAISKLNKICMEIVRLNDFDFKEMESVIQEQAEYIHPLKNATAARYHSLAEHNKKVLASLRSLKETIESLRK